MSELALVSLDFMFGILRGGVFFFFVSEVVGVRGMVDGWVGPRLHLDSGKQPDQPLSARAALQSISGPCSCPEQAV